MKILSRLFPAMILGLGLVSGAAAQSAAPSALQKSLEAYLRHAFALGPDVQIAVGAPTEIGNSGLLETNIDFKTEQGSDKVKMYITKDGHYLLRGELSDLTKDPLTENISKMDLKGAPVLGDPKATVTIVEYGDFECPVCRNLHDAMRGLLPNYPQVKLVFKDFPLDSVHPWARTAALAGRCVYQQNPGAFWKYYDYIYDQQDLISASNIYDKVVDFASQNGLNADTLKSCIAAPQAASEVDASIANGNLLEVRSTPTLFVNGRRVVGADPHALQQYIDYELAQQKSARK
ncbi:MAG TPA: thioredoxin domain-containing protein [Candidatus Eisenbacteria bacterium]|nr:thioredoxin domain-containing protein [Candidatus Eisenbacteria bacterium]